MSTSTEGERSILEKGERFYAVSELAYTLNLTESTVRRYIKNGQIEATKHVKMWRITKTEVERFIKNGPREGKDLVQNV